MTRTKSKIDLPALEGEAAHILQHQFEQALRPEFKTLSENLVKEVGEKVDQYAEELCEQIASLSEVILTAQSNQSDKLTILVRTETEQSTQKAISYFETLKSSLTRAMVEEVNSKKKLTVIIAIVLGILSLSQISMLAWILLSS